MVTPPSTAMPAATPIQRELPTIAPISQAAASHGERMFPIHGGAHGAVSTRRLTIPIGTPIRTAMTSTRVRRRAGV